ncbi:MAG: hypothetical protein KJ558_09280 [Gammaproteobacteria bacterium]|nr:hypothetical protein [Gammaproteobacteria bacterium]MBU1654999.1 hypothetical protein [Gammaproteobacteria bacterium]MBU1960020.1 hypothetical protein [Gammaproteobacteria bacterium]
MFQLLNIALPDFTQYRNKQGRLIGMRFFQPPLGGLNGNLGLFKRLFCALREDPRTDGGHDVVTLLLRLPQKSLGFAGVRAAFPQQP